MIRNAWRQRDQAGEIYRLPAYDTWLPKAKIPTAGRLWRAKSAMGSAPELERLRWPVFGFGFILMLTILTTPASSYRPLPALPLDREKSGFAREY